MIYLGKVTLVEHCTRCINKLKRNQSVLTQARRCVLERYIQPLFPRLSNLDSPRGSRVFETTDFSQRDWYRLDFLRFFFLDMFLFFFFFLLVCCWSLGTYESENMLEGFFPPRIVPTGSDRKKFRPTIRSTSCDAILVANEAETLKHN